MTSCERIEGKVQVISEYVGARVRRELVAEYLDALRRSGKLTDEERDRLADLLLGQAGR